MGDAKLNLNLKPFQPSEEITLREFFKNSGNYTAQAQEKLNELPKDLHSERFKKRLRVYEKLKRKEIKRRKPKTKATIRNKKSKRRR